MREKKYPIVGEAYNKLVDICKQKVEELFPDIDREAAKETLYEELNLLNEHKWCSIFYLVSEIARAAKEKGCMIANRGTIDASIVAYVSGITDINPLMYNLNNKSCFGFNGSKEPYFEMNIADEKTMEIMVARLKEVYIPDKVFVLCRESGLRSYCICVLPEEIEIDDEIKIIIERGTAEVCTGDDVYRIEDKGIFIVRLIEHKDTKLLQNLSERLGVLWKGSNDVFETSINTILNPADILSIDKEKCWDYQLGGAGVGIFEDFAFVKMIHKIKPKTLRDFVDVFSLLHGTGIWVGNMEDGYTATDENCKLHSELRLTDRESVFETLCNAGIDEETAFSIMEYVRKGMIVHGSVPRQKWEKYLDVMKNANIPEWYIEAISKVQYLFPRAHSTDYMVHALDLVYLKTQYPKEFYQAWYDVYKNEINQYEDISELINSDYVDVATVLYEKCQYDDNYYEVLPYLRVLLEMSIRKERVHIDL